MGVLDRRKFASSGSALSVAEISGLRLAAELSIYTVSCMPRAFGAQIPTESKCRGCVPRHLEIIIVRVD